MLVKFLGPCSVFCTFAASAAALCPKYAELCRPANRRHRRCVAKWFALHHLKKPPSGKCHRVKQVYLGDDIKVGRQGRLQVMLLDETIFTLGANSVMRIDVVYDPKDAAKNSLSTSIKKGRSVSSRDRLPSATPMP